MRRKETGELEVPNAEAIARAQKVAKQWLEAGLAERAASELERVETMVSYKTDVGASFHLMLAQVAEACGRSNEAKRLRQRVMSDAQSSSLRWQAEQALVKASPGATSAPSSPANPELSQLFRMPESW